jgi:hypothetical protein
MNRLPSRIWRLTNASETRSGIARLVLVAFIRVVTILRARELADGVLSCS